MNRISNRGRGPCFPSAKKQNFEQFSDVMKAGKRKPAASPGRGDLCLVQNLQKEMLLLQI